jgi:hypothetical protein
MLNIDSRKWSRLRIQRRSNPVPIWIKRKKRMIIMAKGYYHWEEESL